MNEVNVAIVGLGFVGGAIEKSFREKGIKVVGYDKYRNIGSLEECMATDIMFLALPTLFNEELLSAVGATHASGKGNSYDLSAIHEVCEELSMKGYSGVTIIKSTVEPETTMNLGRKYDNLPFIHNPEFLSAATAYEDFHSQKHIVLGKGETCTEKKLSFVERFYKYYYPDAEISICTSTESECMKIFCNSFYAVKIGFFNELYLLCQKLNTNYDEVKAMMLKNGWINPMHTKVPGTDGKLSFGGMCFPKDTKALNYFMTANNSPNMILSAAIAERKAIRNPP